MKFTLDEYNLTSVGAAYVSKEEGKYFFHRFTKDEEKLYMDRQEETGIGYFPISQFTAGIKLRFKTNSEKLYIKAEMHNKENQYFSFDVFEDGEVIGYMDNFSHEEIPPLYPRADFRQGIFEKEFNLKKGESEIIVCFPFNSEIKVHEVSVDDGAFIIPVEKKPKKIIFYGDSITQGYTSLRPSKRYAALLCDAFDADEVNKALGGDIFYPPLTELADEKNPYFIIVSYGTNDWKTCETKEIFIDNCISFVKNLTEKYPDAPIFALSPIWRVDIDESGKMGGIDIIENTISGLSERFENVYFVNGRELVPADIKYYGDARVHPNIDGFEIFFSALYSKIKEYGY